MANTLFLFYNISSKLQALPRSVDNQNVSSLKKIKALSYWIIKRGEHFVYLS